MTVELRDYQKLGVKLLRGQDRSALLWEMGLGKTLTVLSALEARHFPVLVVAPKLVSEVTWPAEIAKWRPELSVAVAAGKPAERQAALHSGADIVTIGNHMLGEIEGRTPWRTIVIDELSAFKGRGKRFGQMRRVTQRKAVGHIWGMTGTPTPNGYLDLWPQVGLLDNGQRLGKVFTHYRDKHFFPGRSLPNGVVTKYHPVPGSEELILDSIQDICMSLSTEQAGIELPEAVLNEVPVALSKTAAAIYNDLKKNMLVDLEDIFGTEMHTAPSAAAISNRLAQITAGFIYTDKESTTGRIATDIHSAKIDKVKEIIEETSDNVLVLYQFEREKEALLAAIPEARLATSKGTLAAWDRGEVPVMLSHPKSIGHGLNLQGGGHTMIWTTLDWSLEAWQQTNKRLHRSGQQHTVMVHWLAARGPTGKETVDHLRFKRLTEKAEVQDEVLAHLASPI